MAGRAQRATSGMAKQLCTQHTAQQWYRRALSTEAEAASTAAAASSSSSGQPSSSSRRPSKTRPSRRRQDVDITKVDLVGPPDPVSNIRPMFYAPVVESSASSASAPTSSTSAASSKHSNETVSPHPYSLSEFSQTSSLSNATGKGKRRHRGLAFFKSYRDLVDRVSDRVEESELKLRVAKLGTDNVTQRFWRDNNTRFTRDLQSWREGSNKQRLTGPTPATTTTATSAPAAQSAMQKEPALAEEMSREESVFYANWLKANAKRNRSYNVLVWKQAWEQVRLGARVNLLRTWLKLLQSFQ